MSGVTPANIRFYERSDLLPQGKRGANSYRRYGERDIHQLRFIRTDARAIFTARHAQDRALPKQVDVVIEERVRIGAQQSQHGLVEVVGPRTQAAGDLRQRFPGFHRAVLRWRLGGWLRKHRCCCEVA